MPDSTARDIVIVGGGAAGLTAGIAAARAMKGQGSVLILEHGQRVGKKLLSTGNGRCNLTNVHASVENYHGASSGFISSILGQFSPQDTMRYFASLGLLCREEEDGRVYPYSGQAAAVLDLLRGELALLGVQELCDCNLISIKRHQQGFLLTTNTGELYTRKLIMATGGKALPSSGSDGSGYAFMQSLHHTVTPVFPALVQIKTDAAAVRSLKGLRCQGSITLLADGKARRTENGEIQFTESGLSGICTFQLSRMVSEYFLCKTIHGTPCKKIELVLDLMPEYEEDRVCEMVRERVKLLTETTLENFLVGILNKRIGQAMLKAAGFSSLSVQSRDLTDAALSTIAHTIKGWRFMPTGTMPWNHAQITAGGVTANEFSPKTLESINTPGLYAAGELLDVDGDCGGYNLQWAWSSGYVAGTSAAAALLAQNRP